MAAKAAGAGAGYVTVATPDACANLIRMALPCVPVVGVPSDSRGAFGAAAASAVRASWRISSIACCAARA